MKKMIYSIILTFLITACDNESSKMEQENFNDTPVQQKHTEEGESNVAHYTKAVDQYLSSLNDSNLEGILSLYAEDGTVEDPVGSEIVSGMTNLRKFYTGAVNVDLKVERTGPVRIADNNAAFPFQLEMNVDGERTLTDIIDVFRFNEEGEIVSMRAYHGPSNRKEIDKEVLPTSKKMDME